MSSNIKINDTVRVTVSFLDYDADVEEEVLVDPTSTDILIYKFNTSTSEWDSIAPVSSIVQKSFGIYYYDWIPLTSGRFKLTLTGTIDDTTPYVISNERTFYVGTAEPTVTLGPTDPIYFLGELDPLYIDPESVLDYFAEGDLVEITELVYWRSLEVEELLNSTNLDVNGTIQEYIMAAVLCDLSKIHLFEGGLGGFQTAESFQLGDLQVSNAKSPTSRGSRITRANVSNWCELANLLRDELLRKKINIKAIVKGSNYPNPIPCRRLRSFDGGPNVNKF